MASVPVIAKGEGGMPVGVQVLGSSHRFIFLRLGKQVLLNNQIERACPKDVVVVACHPVVRQGVLSLASIMGTSRWRYPRISPENPPEVSLKRRLGQNYEYSPDPPTRRLVRILEPPRRREGRVEDRPVDLQRVEIQRRVEDRPADPRRIEVFSPVGYLSIPDLEEEIIFDRIEEWLCLIRGGHDKVHQP